MRLYTVLWVVVAAVFCLTLVLDVTQQKTVYEDKIVIAFASMWAPGEPMMKGYEELFRRFEQEHPEYKVEPRWDGRWVLAALRPRLLTGTNIPDIVNTERVSPRPRRTGRARQATAGRLSAKNPGSVPLRRR